MPDITEKPPQSVETVMLKIAREIAMDMRTIDEILEFHEVSREKWEFISKNPSFQTYLRQCVEEWQSAVNTSERVKIKSMAFIEEALPEFYARAHDPKEALNHKVEVLKTVARFAGMGGSVDGAVTGERLSVTINLGSDHQLKIEKDVSPKDRNQDVYDHQPNYALDDGDRL